MLLIISVWQKPIKKFFISFLRGPAAGGDHRSGKVGVWRDQKLLKCAGIGSSQSRTRLGISRNKANSLPCGENALLIDYGNWIRSTGPVDRDLCGT